MFLNANEPNGYQDSRGFVTLRFKPAAEAYIFINAFSKVLLKGLSDLAKYPVSHFGIYLEEMSEMTELKYVFSCEEYFIS